MSKKDRKNRDSRSNFQEDYDLANGNFDEIEDSFSSSLDEFNEEFEQATASLRQTLDEKAQSLGAESKKSLVDDSVDEDDENQPGLISRMTSVFSSIPIGKVSSALLALPALIYGGLCWTGGKAAFLGRPVIGMFRKIGSLMVLKNMDEDDERAEEKTVTAKALAKDSGAAKTSADQAKNGSQAAKTVVSTKNSKNDTNLVSKNEFIEDDEFDEVSSPWIGYAIKAAAIVGVLLLGVGGYYGIKTTLLNKKNEKKIEQTIESTKDLENKTEIAKAASVPIAEPKDKIANKVDLKTIEKTKSVDPKNSDMVKKKPESKSAETKKNQADVPKKTAESKEKKPESQNPVIAASIPKKSQDKPKDEDKKKPVEPPKPNSTNSVGTFAFAVPDVQTDQAAPKTASSPFDLPITELEKTQSPLKKEDKPELHKKPEPKTEVQNSSLPDIPDPFAAAIAPVPSIKEASQSTVSETSAKIKDDLAPVASMPNDLWTLPTTPTSNNLNSSNPKETTSAEQKFVALTDAPLTAPSTPNHIKLEPQPDLQTLTASTSDASPKTEHNMQPLASIAPLQPLVSATSNSASSAFQPLVPPNDSVPGIPHSGDSPFPIASQMATPQAPKVDRASQLMSRSNAIPPLEPQIQKPETTPTIPMGDAPIAIKSANLPVSTNRSEGTLGIPTDRTPSIGNTLSDLAASNMPEQGIAIPDHTTPSTPVFGTPLASTPQPQLEQTSPHLGSGLQNQMQEFRNQQGTEANEPQLRFGNNTQNNQGAVRFDSNIPQNASFLSMPTSPNDPVDNVLFGLNPTGQQTENTRMIGQSLPPESSSPQPVFADVRPGYRSLANNVPAQAQLDSSANDKQIKQENRALLFRQHVEQSVTKSPQTAEKYTVKSGDTYMTISNEKFGTHLLYRALAEHNRRLGAAYMPTEGTVIEIPTAEYLQSNYAEVLSKGARPRGNRNAVGTTRTLENSSRTTVRYTVQDGDSVMSIATNQLRDSHRWREIIELNADQIKDARDIRSGMQILLPSDTTTSTANGSFNSFGRR